MKVGDFVKAISFRPDDYTHWYEHVIDYPDDVLDLAERSGIIIGLRQAPHKIEVLWSDGVCETMDVFADDC